MMSASPSPAKPQIAVRVLAAVIAVFGFFFALDLAAPTPASAQSPLPQETFAWAMVNGTCYYQVFSGAVAAGQGTQQPVDCNSIPAQARPSEGQCTVWTGSIQDPQPIRGASCSGTSNGISAGPLSTDTNVKQLTNGLLFYALIACVVVMFIAAALWAMGSRGQNPGQELTGKRGFTVALAAAFFIGAIPGIMDFLAEQTHAADTVGVTTAHTSSGGTGGGGQVGGCTVLQSQQGLC